MTLGVSTHRTQHIALSAPKLSEPQVWCGSPFPDRQLSRSHTGGVPALQGVPQELSPSSGGLGLTNKRGGGPIQY